VRFRIAEGTEPERAIEKIRAIVKAHPRVLADPAPSVLFDHSAAENTLEIAVTFSTAQDEAAAVKSDLINAVHTALDTEPRKQGARPS
jgi:small-conductance mechanosensitive channel